MALFFPPLLELSTRFGFLPSILGMASSYTRMPFSSLSHLFLHLSLPFLSSLPCIGAALPASHILDPSGFYCSHHLELGEIRTDQVARLGHPHLPSGLEGIITPSGCPNKHSRISGLWYNGAWVKETEFTNGYSTFTIAGRKLKETSTLGPRPPIPIEIYEFESCPFCRKVREMISILDLDVLFYPCPKGGPNFRPKAIQLGGKQQFPYMVDPNTGVSMYESDDIMKYLAEKYGSGKVPLMLSLGFFTTVTAGMAMIARMGKGSSYTPARIPEKPLDLWAYEASPFCKLVRETLVELELPHIYHSVARGSKKREELFNRIGHFQVPYLEDPNTGVKMFESAEIVEYLKATYMLAQPQIT